MTQPLAIVMIVMIVGISYYLWRMHYLRSRAAMLTIGCILIALLILALNPYLNLI